MGVLDAEAYSAGGMFEQSRDGLDEQVIESFGETLFHEVNVLR